MSGSGNIAVLPATIRAPSAGLAAWMKLDACELSNQASIDAGSAAPICPLARQSCLDRRGLPCGRRPVVHATGRPAVFRSRGSAPGGEAGAASGMSSPSGMFRGLRHSDKKHHTAGHTLKIYGRYMFFGPHERGLPGNERRDIPAALLEEMVAA